MAATTTMAADGKHVAVPLHLWNAGLVSMCAVMIACSSLWPHSGLFSIPGLLMFRTALPIHDETPAYGGALSASALVSLSCFATCSAIAFISGHATTSLLRARVFLLFSQMYMVMTAFCATWYLAADIYLVSESRNCAFSLSKALCALAALSGSSAITHNIAQMQALWKAEHLDGDPVVDAAHGQSSSSSLEAYKPTIRASDMLTGGLAVLAMILLRTQPRTSSILLLASLIILPVPVFKATTAVTSACAVEGVSGKQEAGSLASALLAAVAKKRDQAGLNAPHGGGMLIGDSSSSANRPGAEAEVTPRSSGSSGGDIYLNWLLPCGVLLAALYAGVVSSATVSLIISHSSCARFLIPPLLRVLSVLYSYAGGADALQHSVVGDVPAVHAEHCVL